MEITSKLSERLKELMFDCGQIKSEALAAKIGVAGTSVRAWMNATRNINLVHAVGLADFFHCSLDYLAGISDTDREVLPRPLPPFYGRLREVMKEQGVSRYKIAQLLHADVFFTNWAHGEVPMLYTVCTIADFLNVSLDYLVGRTDY